MVVRLGSESFSQLSLLAGPILSSKSARTNEILSHTHTQKTKQEDVEVPALLTPLSQAKGKET